MYARFIEELKTYSNAIGILSKGYLPIYLLLPSKLERMLRWVRIALPNPTKTTTWFWTDCIIILWHETGDFWNRQSGENLIIQFQYLSQPRHSERIDYVPNWNCTSPLFWIKWASAGIHPAKNRETLHSLLNAENLYNSAYTRTEHV